MLRLFTLFALVAALFAPVSGAWTVDAHDKLPSGPSVHFYHWPEGLEVLPGGHLAARGCAGRFIPWSQLHDVTITPEEFAEAREARELALDAR